MPDGGETARRISLLRAAITSSGLSASAYARDILIREPRTIRRWLAGDSPIPESVLHYLTRAAAAVAGS